MWEYQTEEGSHDLFMDIGEEIRFRVVEERFVDTIPTDGGCGLNICIETAFSMSHFRYRGSKTMWSMELIGHQICKVLFLFLS